MLILARNQGESFVIGKNREITIYCLNINNHQARIGIIAPDDVPIVRSELIDERQKILVRHWNNNDGVTEKKE